MGGGGKRKREEGGGEKEIEFFIYGGNRYADMPFYIQPLSIQGTILDLIHVHIF